jgi:hypothetical protein
MRASLYSALPVLVAIAAAAPAAAQTCVGERGVVDVTDPFSARFDVVRLLQLTGAAPPGSLFARRTSTASAEVCAGSAAPLRWAVGPQQPVAGANRVSWGLSAPSLSHGYNSAYPRNINEGAVWQGVGSAMRASAGVRARWRWFDAQLSPEFVWQQNARFAVATHPDRPQYSPWAARHHHGIDWYQRPGDHSVSDFLVGQSHIRATAGPASLGLATENVWIGAARIYPILLSTTAPGFPHVFVETARPVRTPVGTFEVYGLWGRLSESDWFDFHPDNDKRLFTALTVAYSPAWIPGLHIGAARVYHETLIPGEFDLGNAFGAIMDRSFLGSGGGNRPEGNALAAIYARWAFPQVGFEVYGEWSREDTPWEIQDLLREPDWTQAYALGFQQFLGDPGAPRAFRWYGELVHLGESAPMRAGRGDFSYYTHAQVLQGHTNRGQLLGAWIGPGSDAQTLGADVLYGRGLSGLWLERVRYDDDTYYRRFADRYGETRHDVELTGGFRQLVRAGGLEVDGFVTYSSRQNRNFIAIHAEDLRDRVERNWGLKLRAQWFTSLTRPVP